MKRAAGMAVLLLLAGISLSAQAPAPPPTPTFKGGINFVRVDVRVTDHQGHPVRHLQPSDFQVREDGRLQRIQSFQFISVDPRQPVGPVPPAPLPMPAQQQAAAAAGDNVRLVAIFLDDYHVDAGDSMAVRAQLDTFIENDLAPSDLVGVMYPLTPIADVVFTPDHQAAEQAIDSFLGRRYDYGPRNDLEKRYADEPAEVVERIRNRASLSAIIALVDELSSLREGRKAVLLVSEGYSDYLPPQMRDPIATAPGFFNPAAGNPFALDPRGLATFQFGIQRSVGAKLDQKVLRQTQDTLRTLADETDGRAMINQNDMTKGLAQLARDLNDYYLIGYVSSAPSDGRFHPIDVRVTRPGVVARARRGYWALTAEVRFVWQPRGGTDGGDAGGPPVARVMLTAMGRGGSPYFQGPVPRASGPSQVIFQAPPGALRLRLSVQASDGHVLDLDDRTVQVPDFTAPQVSISTPALLLARSAYEQHTLEAAANPAPTPARAFSRADTLLIRFHAYAPGGSTPAVAASLLNREGSSIATLPVAATQGGRADEVALPLATLPPGEYLVKITADSGGSSADTLVAFSVVS